MRGQAFSPCGHFRSKHGGAACHPPWALPDILRSSSVLHLLLLQRSKLACPSLLSSDLWWQTSASLFCQHDPAKILPVARMESHKNSSQRQTWKASETNKTTNKERKFFWPFCNFFFSYKDMKATEVRSGWNLLPSGLNKTSLTDKILTSQGSIIEHVPPCPVHIVNKEALRIYLRIFSIFLVLLSKYTTCFSSCFQ